MIVLDTHIWVWWVHDDKQLLKAYKEYIEQNEQNGIGISAISCWEVAKLVEYGRLNLPVAITDWFDQALAYPGVRLLDLTPRIAIESTQLPSPFHKDPADQIIVATARVYQVPLVTIDGKMRQYPHVQLAP
ncbi:MAG: type II toxin-antitoxin system VapC family toxin [Blastochloris sp.]|nr:type II toxin-antitoxin system VapC family toxin [Blastochloris sp.]